MPVVRNVQLDRYFTQPHLPTFMTEYQRNLYIDVPGSGVVVLNSDGNL